MKKYNFFLLVLGCLLFLSCNEEEKMDGLELVEVEYNLSVTMNFVEESLVDGFELLETEDDFTITISSIRHNYVKILQSHEIKTFKEAILSSKNIGLCKVANYYVISFKNENIELKYHSNGKIFSSEGSNICFEFQADFEFLFPFSLE